MIIADQLAHIHHLIRTYEEKYDRPSNSVSLLAVSKGQSLEKIQAALLAGQQSFGENHLQEALEKIQALSHEAIEWHFIGNIQSNKTRKIAEHFTWVQSVASKKIAQRLNDQRPPHLLPLNICIEINLNNETTKSGVLFSECKALMDFCLTLPHLRLRGIMSIPAPQSSFEQQRQSFRQLHEIFLALREEGLDIDTLSMGMSDDFEAAIAEGSTLVRVGSAIFGKREPL